MGQHQRWHVTGCPAAGGGGGRGLCDSEDRDKERTAPRGETWDQKICKVPPPSPRPHASEQKLTNTCKIEPHQVMAHPRPPYLEHEDTHVGNSQVNSGPLSVRSCVKSNAIHFQLSGNLKHLEIRLGRRLAPIIKDGMITALKTTSVLKKPKHITKLIRKTKHNRTIQRRKFVSEWTAHCKFIYPQKCSILHTQTKETVSFYPIIHFLTGRMFSFYSLHAQPHTSS